MGNLAVAYGTGGLKATAHALAIEQVLRENKVGVGYRCGTGGGAIAAACMSTNAGQSNGPRWVAQQLGRIVEKQLLDESKLQQTLGRLLLRAGVADRRGEKPMGGWYRGTGLYQALRDLLTLMGPVVSPLEIVTCTLEGEHDPSSAPLAAMSRMVLKKVRQFQPSDGMTTSTFNLLAKSLRAACGTPFIFPGFAVEGEVLELDGGVLSLTTEEVAADYVAFPPRGVSRNMSVVLVSDTGNLPEAEDRPADDVIELASTMMVVVGQTLAQTNYHYASRRLQEKGGGLVRLTPPQVKFSMRHYETARVVDLYTEYLNLLRHDDKLERVIAVMNQPTEAVAV